MRSHWKNIVLLITMASLASCTPKSPPDKVWDAITLGLPEKIAPEAAVINMGLYVLKQTHEPLFRYDHNSQFYSRVLKKWSRSPDTTQYTFCPDQSQSFSENSSFSMVYFKKYLKRTVEKLNKRAKLRLDKKCGYVTLNKPSDSFLKQLTFYENAPSLEKSGQNWELGLGPFEITSKTDKEIHLKRKAPTSGGYNEIRFSNYQGKKDPALKSRKIEDFNRVLLTDLPGWIKNDYLGYDLALLQSVNLVINHPDKNIRKFLYNCLDVKKLRRVFMPKQKTFADIKNLLPVGVPGSQSGLPKQECKKITYKKPLTFANWNAASTESLRTYFNEFEKRHGVKINIETYTLNEYLKVIFQKPHPYQMTIIALDAVRPDYGSFYDAIARKGGITDLSLPKGVNLLDGALASSRKKTQIRKINELNELIKNEAIVLPLYQEVRKFYYPQHVKNIDTGRDFLEYPEVAEVKL